MAMSVHSDLIFGAAGQSLYWDAPEGRPSSVTSVTVYPRGGGDDGATEDATSGAAAIDSVATTFDASSGASESDRTICHLTSTAGIVAGRSYLATDARGRKEWARVAGIEAGASVIAAEPLRLTFASGDAFESTRIAINVSDAWAADTNHLSDDPDPNPGYRVRWEYVVDGVSRVHASYFDLLRYPGEHSVTPAIMRDILPSWSDTLPTYHALDNGQRLINEAYDMVKFDLFASGLPDEMIRNAEIRERLVKLAALAQLQKARFYEGTAAPEAMERAMLDYNVAINGLVAHVNKTDFASSTSGAASRLPGANVWRR
jgi:hypothetical protein